MNNKTHLIGIGVLFKEAGSLFKKGFWRLLAVMLIAWVISFIPILLIIATTVLFVLPGAYFIISEALQDSGFSWFNEYVLKVLPNLAGKVNSSIPIIIGLALACLAVLAGFWGALAQIIAVRDIREGIGIKRAFKEAWKKLLSFTWISLLTSLIIFAGFLLLIVPGIIFSIWFAFVAYVLVCENIKGKAALSRSKELVKGCWWPILGRLALLTVLIFIVNIIVGATKLGLIGTAITNLISIFALIYNLLIYQDLKRIKQDNAGTVSTN